MKTPTNSSGEMSDAELVSLSLSGDLSAFEQIVTRYQTLICSLAYNATGSLTESEDLSQETFLAAWKQLADLQEPGKLRSWLCGIARNLGHRLRRSQRQEPAQSAEKIDFAQETAAVDPIPRDRAVSAEEEAIMWRALERIPEAYREPLILFYREHQSVERVAQVLELSEEVVRQRLSRGRKLLRDEVAAFVTGALQRSAPSSAFASAVLAAIPAGSGGFAASAGAAKASGLLPWFTFPILGIFASLTGSIATIRNSTTAGERQSKKRLISAMWLAGVALWFAQQALRTQRTLGKMDDRVFVDAQVVCYVMWAAIVTPLVIVYIRRHIAGIERSEFPTEYRPVIKRKLTHLLGTCALTFGAIAWLIYLTWQLRDFLAMAIAIAVTAAVLVWQCGLFFWPRLGALTRIPRSRLAWTPTIAVVGVIFLLLNWRLDRWIALIRGQGLAEAHAFLPMWMVHGSTLLVMSWAVIVLMITKPKNGLTKSK